jgi:hypothetical protein
MITGSAGGRLRPLAGFSFGLGLGLSFGAPAPLTQPIDRALHLHGATSAADRLTVDRLLTRP